MLKGNWSKRKIGGNDEGLLVSCFTVRDSTSRVSEVNKSISSIRIDVVFNAPP